MFAVTPGLCVPWGTAAGAARESVPRGPGLRACRGPAGGTVPRGRRELSPQGKPRRPALPRESPFEAGGAPHGLELDLGPAPPWGCGALSRGRADAAAASGAGRSCPLGPFVSETGPVPSLGHSVRLDVRGGRSSLGSTVVGGHADRKPGLWLDTSVIQTVPSPDFRFKLNTPSAQPRKREEPTCYQEPVQEALEEPSQHCPGSQQHTEASLLPVPSWPRGLGGVPSHPEATAPHHSS
ncbi:uncharacterized protein AAEQ78_001292 [Lycaon pictus]